MGACWACKLIAWLLNVMSELLWKPEEEESGQGKWCGFVQVVGRQWGPPSSIGGDLIRWVVVS